MARVHHVAKRRVGKRGEYALSCRDCGQPINYGEPYKWTKVKRSYGGVKLSYHPGCTILPTHVSTSKLAVIWEAQRGLTLESCEDVDGLQGGLADLADTVEEVAAEYRESVDNMESGFGHRTYQADELEERAEALEAWAEELRDWEPQDADEPQREDYPDTNEGGEDFNEAHDAWLDAAREEAGSLADECPV